MWLYSGMFWIAFATLVFEITLTRILSVVTWYYLAFFAVAMAMLGMTAGAIRVYLQPNRFRQDRVHEESALASLYFALSVPAAMLALCLIPLEFSPNTAYICGVIVCTVMCALPFFFSGMAVSILLTKHWAPVGRLYASDLLGASLGCLFVLAALGWMDAISLVLVAGAVGGVAGWCLLQNSTDPKARKWRIRALVLSGALLLVGFFNTSQSYGLRPLLVKGRIEPSSMHLCDEWNSYSRITVSKEFLGYPQLWSQSPVFHPKGPVHQYAMAIDGSAGTFLRQFHEMADIDHLRYDITSMAHYIRPTGKACVIGVGGARDIQCALLFGHDDVLGVEINPIFVNLLKWRFRTFAGVDRPDVRLVVDEARGYLSRSTEQFDVLQMSLIDTWAATGAGAYSLSENGLYTIEAWKVFLSRLSDNGVFTVSRWHNVSELGETGRVISLAVATLFEMGIKNPRDHIALVSSRNISTLIISKSPLQEADIAKLTEICTTLDFKPTILPGKTTDHKVLEMILSAPSVAEMNNRLVDLPLNYEAPTDENPYFFNMLRLKSAIPMIGGKSTSWINMMTSMTGLDENRTEQGVLAGNLKASISLIELIGLLAVLTVLTIIVPLLVASRHRRRTPSERRLLWTGGLYFSLIGIGFMLLEMSLMQRLSLYLSHPVYALGILLFSIIAATGVGSYLSEFLPLTKKPWIYIYPIAMCVIILVVQFMLRGVIAATITWDQSFKIVISVLVIAPIGLVLGFFFPTGMKLFKRASEHDMPWFWAMNGIFGVLSSAIAVFISIFLGVSFNFYFAALCYLAIAPVLLILTKITAGLPSPAPVMVPAAAGAVAADAADAGSSASATLPPSHGKRKK
jgi:hypothetical protein